MKRTFRNAAILIGLMIVTMQASAMIHDVSISGFAFQPAQLTITEGDTVRWTNHDSAPHTATADDNSFNSGYLATNATFSFAFASAGSFPYACLYHPTMTALIEVTAGGGGHSDHFHEVSIAGLQFLPADLAIAIGDTVSWTNNDNMPHTVSAADNSFDSGNLSVGATFMHVFASAGDFAYVCEYHSNMSAVIHAVEPAQRHDISIMGSEFIPAALTINVGDTVRWTNHDAMPHRVMNTDDEFLSDTLAPGESFEHVFLTEGSYLYLCFIHPDEMGEIHVGVSSESEWVELESPTSLPLNDVRFWDENLGWAGGEQGVLRTTNGGESWTMVGTSDDVEAVFFASECVGWACGNDGMIVHSTNGGQSWTPQVSGFGDKLRDIWFVNNQTGWAVGRDGVLLHTTDGGQNWDPQTSPAVDDLRGIHMLDALHGWIVGSDGLVLYTSNGGTTWTPQLSVPGGEEDEFEAVFALDGNRAWTAGGQGRIYSTSNGQDWSPQTSGTNVALMDIFSTSTSEGWVCGAAGFLANTINGGVTWTVQDPPAVASFNSIYFVNSNLGFTVAGDGRIFKYAPEPTAISPDENAGVPQSAALIGNYPNPFNPSTTIEFQLNANGHARLEIFDILGQQVATLLDGPMAAGTHQLEFNGDNLPSGIYFYQLHAAEQVFTRRMLLVK